MAVLSVLVLLSCRKEPVNYDPGYAYYPIESGRYITYDVVEIFHDDAVSVHDTDIYQLKEVIESDFIDNEGRLSYRLKRYKRTDPNQDWQISDIWVVTGTKERVERVEENEKLIKLVFPVKDDEEWDVNAYNSENKVPHTYANVGVQKTVNGVPFPHTATVLQQDFRTGAFFYEYAYEIYAREVGMVRKYSKLLEIELFDTTNVLRGTELYQTITDFGVE